MRRINGGCCYHNWNLSKNEKTVPEMLPFEATLLQKRPNLGLNIDLSGVSIYYECFNVGFEAVNDSL